MDTMSKSCINVLNSRNTIVGSLPCLLLVLLLLFFLLQFLHILALNNTTEWEAFTSFVPCPKYTTITAEGSV